MRGGLPGGHGERVTLPRPRWNGGPVGNHAMDWSRRLPGLRMKKGGHIARSLGHSQRYTLVGSQGPVTGEGEMQAPLGSTRQQFENHWQSGGPKSRQCGVGGSTEFVGMHVLMGRTIH